MATKWDLLWVGSLVLVMVARLVLMKAASMVASSAESTAVKMDRMVAPSVAMKVFQWAGGKAGWWGMRQAGPTVEHWDLQKAV